MVSEYLYLESHHDDQPFARRQGPVTGAGDAPCRQVRGIDAVTDRFQAEEVAAGRREHDQVAECRAAVDRQAEPALRPDGVDRAVPAAEPLVEPLDRSEEHTSELQSPKRIS